MLHVTNGDVAAERIRAALETAGETAEVLAWRDPLHEGPVPARLGERELARVRAAFIAEQGWGDRDETLSELERRDAVLSAATGITLWFESDLYDQLQLAQVLDRLAASPAAGERWLVEARPDPASGRFVALGELAPERLAELQRGRRAIGAVELDLGSAAWRAFCAPDPRGLAALAAAGTPALPDLAPALRRLLEELPWVGSGLDRTAAGVLRDLARGPRRWAELFASHLASEARPFLGDTIFGTRLGALAAGPRPLVELDGIGADGNGVPFGGRTARLAAAGREVVAGGGDAVRLNGIDRWLGGVRLLARPGAEAVWRWDPAAGVSRSAR